MRTVFEKIGLPSLGALALLAAFLSAENPVIAQNAPPPAPVTPSVAGSNDTVSNLANSAMGVAPTAPPVTAPAAAPAIAPIAAPVPPAVDAATDNDKGVSLETEEENVPKSVNAVIRHLDKETENITLSDLNSARQAIAKVETLIELEKKLGELEKVQKERDNKSGSPSAVPASMLMPTAAVQPELPRLMPPPASMMSDVDIDRIVGGAGEYKAVIKMPDGSTKAVGVGDTLPDGGVVSRISSSGMEIAHGDTKQTVHIKNVDMVFGVAP